MHACACVECALTAAVLLVLCWCSAGVAAQNCETAGNQTITIYGQNLVEPTKIQIGNDDCTDVQAFGSRATGRLPAGTGVKRKIVVTSRSATSTAVCTVSYGAAVIQRINAAGGCVTANDQSAVSDCPRDGGSVTLTLVSPLHTRARRCLYCPFSLY
jgi:hypothetical protein